MVIVVLQQECRGGSRQTERWSNSRKACTCPSHAWEWDRAEYCIDYSNYGYLSQSSALSDDSHGVISWFIRCVVVLKTRSRRWFRQTGSDSLKRPSSRLSAIGRSASVDSGIITSSWSILWVTDPQWSQGLSPLTELNSLSAEGSTCSQGFWHAWKQCSACSSLPLSFNAVWHHGLKP